MQSNDRFLHICFRHYKKKIKQSAGEVKKVKRTSKMLVYNGDISNQ
jgi:hypothetical protein